MEEEGDGFDNGETKPGQRIITHAHDPKSGNTEIIIPGKKRDRTRILPPGTKVVYTFKESGINHQKVSYRTHRAKAATLTDKQ